LLQVAEDFPALRYARSDRHPADARGGKGAV